MLLVVVVVAALTVVVDGVGGAARVDEAGDTVFTSSSNLPALAELEDELVKHLGDYLANTQQRLDIISRLVHTLYSNVLWIMCCY